VSGGEGRFGPGRLALAVGIVAIGFLSLRTAVDFDYGWHLANGRHLGDGVLFGGVDVYSWTAAGSPWVAHEWLTEVGMAALHDALGPTAVSFATALIVAMAFGLVALRVRGRGFGRATTLATIGLGFAGTLVSMGVRPQLLELLYLGATLLLVDAWLAGRIGRGRLWVLAGAGALLWANTHGSFLLLPGVLGAATGAAVFGRERRWREMAMATVIAGAVPVLNPWGLALYGFAAQSLTSDITGRLVQEWRPPDLLAPSFLPFTLALVLAGLGLVTALVRRAAEPRPRLVFDLLVAAAFLALALRSGRHVMLFGVAAAPLLAAGWSALGARATSLLRHARPTPAPERPRRPIDPRGRDLVNAVVLVAVSAALAIGGLVMVGPETQRRATDARYPTGLLSALDEAVVADRQPHLFNEYTWGGFLIAARPGVRVFIDGRSEVYGDGQLARYAAIAEGGPDAAAALDDLGVDLVLVRADSPLARALLGAGGWSELARDAVGVLLARAGTHA
jgi:hypothetical protein